jgi:ABC-type phosphate/phosphonate transport system substrate-binding protein
MMVSPIIFATFLAPAWYKTYRYVTEYVERYVHAPTFLLNGESLDDFASAYVDAGFISPLAYIQLLDQNPCPVELIAAPVMVGADDPQLPPTFFDIVVRSDSRLQSIDDLRDCVWAYHTESVHVEDQSSYESGVSLADFRSCVEAPSQAQALRLVLDEEADATVIDERRLNLVLRNSSALAAKLRVLSTFCPSPGPLVVVSRHVAPQIRQKIQEAFLTIHQDVLCASRLKEDAIAKFIFVSNIYYKNMRKHHEILLQQSNANAGIADTVATIAASIS